MAGLVLTSLPTECLLLIQCPFLRLAATCSRFGSILAHSDSALWRHIVLAAYDFTATPSATVNDLEIYIDIEDEDIEHDFDESKVDRDVEPPYLIELIVGIAFRASQFGFLKDPFTLFKDLLFLTTAVPAGFEENCKYSEGDGEMFPVLLPNRPGLLMKTIGIHPNVWGRFEEFPFPMNKDRKLMKNEGAEYGVSSTDSVFRGMVEEFLSVHPNKGSDGDSPFFCIGKSKSSGRYLGVCGAVVWT
ncbi:hypothetical protein BDR26DRAFT_851329 [Obelidium mucronatum]|nr:hypothetical protein BDR26DRAFT_851329 [Obelidium mucronatum]